MKRGGFPLPSHAPAKQGQPSQLLPKSRRTDDIHEEIDGTVEQTKAYVATVGGQEDVGIAPCEPELMDEDPCETQGNVTSFLQVLPWDFKNCHITDRFSVVHIRRRSQCSRNNSTNNNSGHFYCAVSHLQK